MEIKDIAGLSEPLTRIIDCLDKGVSSLASPFVYKRMEKAKLLMEQKRADQNAVIALKDAMMQDLIAVARTTRDRRDREHIRHLRQRPSGVAVLWRKHLAVSTCQARLGRTFL